MAHRKKIAEFLEGDLARNAIVGVIILNAIILGLATSDWVMARAGTIITAIDMICLSIFLIELLLKLYALGPKFFRNGWNIFDFVVVSIALVPGARWLSVMRALRILRVLRVISFAPSIRRVVEGFIAAAPGMMSVFLLIAIIFYISSVIATRLFGEAFPDWFDTLGASAYSLFQIMTLESWSMGIVRPVMEVYPYAWAFFVPFIIMTTFAVMNLLVGLVVNAMQEATQNEDSAENERYQTEVLARLEAIEKRLSGGN